MDLVQDRWGASVLSTRPAPGSWYLFFWPILAGTGFFVLCQLLALLFSVLTPLVVQNTFFFAFFIGISVSSLTCGYHLVVLRRLCNVSS